MNTTGDSEDNPGALPPEVPLSAPVAGDMFTARGPRVRRPEPDSAPPFRPVVPPPAPPPPGRASFSSAEHPPGAPDPVPPAPSRPAAGPPAPPPPDRQPFASPPAPVPPAAADDPAPGEPARSGPRGFSPAWSDFHRGAPGGDPPEDPQRVLLRKQLDAVRVRAAGASSWVARSKIYARLVNRDGVVPVTARFSRADVEFLGRAREEVLGFAELGLRLLELHAPLDAGGISTDPSSPIMRCRSCMWRWPCPTFRTLTETLAQLPNPEPPPAH